MTLNGCLKDPDSKWAPCQFVIARSGDKCFVGSWIFTTSSIHVSLILFYSSVYFLKYILYLQEDKLITGRIIEILADEASQCAVVAIDIFQILSSRHVTFGMPMLARSNDERSRIVIPSAVCFFCVPQ